MTYPTFSPVAMTPSGTVPNSRAPSQSSSRPSSPPTLLPTTTPTTPSTSPITLSPTAPGTVPPTFPPGSSTGRRQLLYDDSVTIRITGAVPSSNGSRFNFATYTSLNATDIRTITTVMVQLGYHNMTVRSLKAIRLNSLPMSTRSP